MYYICMNVSSGCAKESLDEVEEQLDIEAGGDNSAMPRSHRCHCVTHSIAVHDHLEWTNDFYYAQQKAIRHVVEGMRLRFQLRSQIRCLRESVRSLGPSGDQ